MPARVPRYLSTFLVVINMHVWSTWAWWLVLFHQTLPAATLAQRQALEPSILVMHATAVATTIERPARGVCVVRVLGQQGRRRGGGSET